MARHALAAILPAVGAIAGIMPAQAAEPSPAPVVYAQKTKGYEVELRIDPALQRYAGVYVNLRDGTLQGFNAFERSADRMQAVAGEAAAGAGPIVQKVEFTLSVATPHLIGVIRRSYEDRHAAQPGYGVQGYILDRASGRSVGASDLLKPGTDMAPLDAALQAAVDKAKRGRHGDHPPPLPPASSLPTWDAGRPAINPRRTPPSDATLAPSAQDGKAGGLQFLYGANDVEPYTDGAYRILLPASVFASALKAPYADDFAGEPSAAPDDPMQRFPPGSAP